MWVETKEPYVFPKIATKCFFTEMCWMGIGGSYRDMIQDLNIFLRTTML
jgi:hypothetical protein